MKANDWIAAYCSLARGFLSGRHSRTDGGTLALLENSPRREAAMSPATTSARCVTGFRAGDNSLVCFHWMHRRSGRSNGEQTSPGAFGFEWT